MTVPDPPARGSAPYHHGDLPAALLEAVADIIRERGIGFVALREAARRARVSHGAPAHHFRNKAGLLTAFAAQGYGRLASAIRAAVAAAGPRDGREQLAAVGRGYVAFALANPEQFGIMFRLELLNADDSAFRTASDAAFGELAQTIGRLGAEGRLQDRDPEVLAVAAWSLVHGFATLWISGRLADRIRRTDPAELSALVAGMFVDGVLG